MLGYASDMTDPQALLRSIEALRSAGRMAEAEGAALRSTGEFPTEPRGWLALATLRRARNALDAAQDAVARGLDRQPHDKALRLLQAELKIQSGAVETGLGHLRALVPAAEQDGALLQHIAQLFTRLNLHAEAARCYRQAVALAPQNPEFLYNLATATIALGGLGEAEALLDRVIALKPNDYDAYYNRATLRRQTLEANHLAELQTALARPIPDAMGAVRLGYALAKELEDLGRYPESFAALKRAADGRRRLLAYRVEEDERAMAEIAAAFDTRYFARPRPAAAHAQGIPVFVLGLPRSGTTLIDRLLASHSEVESLGEINDFAVALMAETPQARNKFELIRASASADPVAFGRRYRETTVALAPKARWRIDKTPLNFLYLGPILAAMPDAVVIHVRRKPMDVCYAMYKTLFRMAYPFSYDLSDLGRYFCAYAKLMDHWCAVLPGGFLNIDYEALVSDQETVTRRLLAHCGLGWEDACLAPERNEAPSLTASAAQVREKVHGRSVGLWRRYAKELAPLAEVLRAGGVTSS